MLEDGDHMLSLIPASMPCCEHQQLEYRGYAAIYHVRVQVSIVETKLKRSHSLW